MRDKVKRVNITLPKRVFKCLDFLAKKARKTRSSMIASMTLKAQKNL
ncbi:MAG: type II toxin-antitoxin system HicB family antitoxin [Zymomonas mobilis subsp. pomaceae]